MRNPAGVECRFYYADYHRGRQHQECRLIARHRSSERWQPELCRTCPVPDILRANACPHMILEARVVKRWLGLRRAVRVWAYCVEHRVEVAEPKGMAAFLESRIHPNGPGGSG